MKAYRIALIPGDGVGQEGIHALRQVLEAVQAKQNDFTLAFTQYPAGKAAYEQFGNALPRETLEGIQQANAAVIGALDGSELPSPSPMGKLRRELQLFADVRPVKAYPGVWCLRPEIDLVFIRENMEGFLADRNCYRGYGELMPTEDTVISLRVLTRSNCERIARYAFEYARTHDRKKITVIHKANVLKEGCGFFLEIVKEVSKLYPDIELQDEYIDSFANNLILKPERYDVVLTTNLFGDIISDEGAALVSNLVASANMGKDHAVFVPVNHHPLHDLAGTNTVNPLPLVLCGAQMLGYLGEWQAAAMIEKAVRRSLINENTKPRDLGGKASTSEVAEAISNEIRQHREAGNRWDLH